MKKYSGWFILLFFIINFLLSSFYIDIWKNANTISRSLPIISYFESGSFRIDDYHELTPDKAHINGHYYTDKAPLPTYFVLPFYGLAKSIGLVNTVSKNEEYGKTVMTIGGLLASALPFALILTLLYLYIRNNNSSISPILLSTLPFYGSFIFIFSGPFFGHLFAAILLLASFLLLRKKAFFLAGLFAGLTFLSEYNLAVLIFCWVLILIWREKKLHPAIIFSAGVLPSLLFILYYNATFSTSPFIFLYKYHSYSELSKNYGFQLPGLEAFWGLTFSPYRGMFFYAPVLIYGLFYIEKRLNFGKFTKILKSYLFLPSIVYFIFIASYFAWWGGWTYGPRLLFGLIVILIFATVEKLSQAYLKPVYFGILSIIGLIIILPAKATIVYDAPTGIKFPFLEIVIPKLVSGNQNPNNILSLYFNIDPFVSFIIFLTFFGFSLIILSILERRLFPKL